jgi:cytochrome P450
MEAAVVEPAAAAAAPPSSGPPPHVPLPRALQTARFLARPIPFYERWRGRLGETFSAKLLGPGDVVFLSDPDSVKRLFTSDRINTIAPGRDIVLRPLLGSQSLLLQQDEEHLRRRKLMLPPFHGERMRNYEDTITEVATAEIASWPKDGAPFALHPSMQAITLEVIMRAVFGVSDPARREAMRDGRARRIGLAGGFRADSPGDQGTAALSPLRGEGGADRRAACRGDRRTPRRS